MNFYLLDERWKNIISVTYLIWLSQPWEADSLTNTLFEPKYCLS